MWEDWAVPNQHGLDVHLHENDFLEVLHSLQCALSFLSSQLCLAVELFQVHVIADLLDGHRGIGNLPFELLGELLLASYHAVVSFDQLGDQVCPVLSALHETGVIVDHADPVMTILFVDDLTLEWLIGDLDKVVLV